uniref:Uncharacterized protein n=1 Tax=Anguilla anguilla TaxID=7936 RepID=A0A0E9WTB3_ANGAN
MIWGLFNFPFKNCKYMTVLQVSMTYLLYLFKQKENSDQTLSTSNKLENEQNTKMFFKCHFIHICSFKSMLKVKINIQYS